MLLNSNAFYISRGGKNVELLFQQHIMSRVKTNLFHNSLNSAHIPYWWRRERSNNVKEE